MAILKTHIFLGVASPYGIQAHVPGVAERRKTWLRGPAYEERGTSQGVRNMKTLQQIQRTDRYSANQEADAEGQGSAAADGVTPPSSQKQSRRRHLFSSNAISLTDQ
ncbi:hypothetical protein D623_10029949 [Myotis brandtii]|uniref:Uncharacterized protein n=1 Tax=Myotis brandtii TaxID=109478 RepID=S7MHA2_MYOBR|nr:hypothetical protein D623_10029949 [Myotis brandtii]